MSLEARIESVKNLNANTKITTMAEDVRKGPTGIHAKILFFLNRTLLPSWDNFNIERGEYRTRFINRIIKDLKQHDVMWDEKELHDDFSIFCATLWREHISRQVATPMAGDALGQPQKFLAHPHILEGGGTILFAPPKRGKSYTALLYAVSVDSGSSIFWPTQKTKVLFLNLERSASSLSRRLGCINNAIGEDPARPLLTMNARGKSLIDISGAVEETVRRHDVGLIVLDSISRAGYGDLNDNRVVNSVIDTMNGLCDTWLGLAHTPRSDESHIYGGVHFEAGADIILQLLSAKESDSLGIGIEVNQANDIGDHPITVLSYEFDEIGISGITKSNLSKFPELMAGRKMSLGDELASYLTEEVGEATSSQASQALGKERSEVSRLFYNDHRFVKTRQEGREKYYGVKAT
jgi:hypothetical protein